MRIGKESTSEERILRFLDITQDYNRMHKDRKIFPGMFYLALSAPYIRKPISSLEINFRHMVEYPFECELVKEDIKNGTRLEFRKNRHVLCIENIFFNEAKEQDIVAGLEDFARNIGTEQDYQNLRKIWLVCCIPGKLMRYLGNNQGIYLKQTLAFLKKLPKNVKLKIKLNERKKKRRDINMNYVDGKEVIATGNAEVAIF